MIASASLLLAQATQVRGEGEKGLTITLFLIFVAITLGITIWASKQTSTAAEFYAAGRAFSPFRAAWNSG